MGDELERRVEEEAERAWDQWPGLVASNQSETWDDLTETERAGWKRAVTRPALERIVGLETHNAELLNERDALRARIVELEASPTGLAYHRARVKELEGELATNAQAYADHVRDLEAALASAKRESARHNRDAGELLGDLVKARESIAGLEGERDESAALVKRYGVSLAEERAKRVEADRQVALLRATVAGLTEELVRVRAEGRRS